MSCPVLAIAYLQWFTSDSNFHSIGMVIPSSHMRYFPGYLMKAHEIPRLMVTLRTGRDNKGSPKSKKQQVVTKSWSIIQEISYPPEVGRGKYWGLGVFLFQYFPLVNIWTIFHYNCIKHEYSWVVKIRDTGWFD